MTNNVIEIGDAHMIRRYNDCMALAQEVADKRRLAQAPMLTFDIHTPEFFVDGHWGTKSVTAWPLYGRYLVGYATTDPLWTIRIYRKQFEGSPPNAETNQTYEVYPKKLWQDSEYDRLESALKLYS